MHAYSDTEPRRQLLSPINTLHISSVFDIYPLVTTFKTSGFLYIYNTTPTFEWRAFIIYNYLKYLITIPTYSSRKRIFQKQIGFIAGTDQFQTQRRPIPATITHACVCVCVNRIRKKHHHCQSTARLHQMYTINR
jgi:hypothetical protein